MNKFAFRRLVVNAVQLLMVTEPLGQELELAQSKSLFLTSVCTSSAVIVFLNFVLKKARIHFVPVGIH